MAKTPITTKEHVHRKMIDPIARTTKGTGLETSRTMVHTTRQHKIQGQQ
jgi:hypothetical protein